MKCFRELNLKMALAGVACVGLLLPQSVLQAGGLQTIDSDAVKRAAVVVDVALGENGTLTGQVVDSQGIGLDGVVVSMTQGQDEVATSVTNKEGVFVVKDLRGGVYQIVAGQAVGSFRLWAANTAPPSARAKAVLVSSDQFVRGQGILPFGGVDAITAVIVAGVITTVTLSIINHNDIQQIEDDVNEIKSMSP